ncbi:hypothetical protein [Polynucleobacter sp. 31A-FELB]|nr:hypothetical protein [Polynucleobacter sp. 31A-FELB]
MEHLICCALGAIIATPRPNLYRLSLCSGAVDLRHSARFNYTPVVIMN